MSSTSCFAKRLARLVPARFYLVVVALVTLGFTAIAGAQTATGGSLSFPAGGTTPVTSTVTVSGATGPVATVQVELDGVNTAAGQSSQTMSMQGVFFMLTSPDGRQFEFLGATGDGTDGDDAFPPDAGTGVNGLNITVVDSGNAAPTTAWQHSGAVTVKPSSYNEPSMPILPTSGGTTANWAQTDGGSTGLFNNRMAGATGNGTWTLTLMDKNTFTPALVSDAVSITGWKLTLTYSALIATTTSLSDSASDPAFETSQTVELTNSFTATVATSPTGQGTPTGTVAFTANGATASGCSAVALSGGTASCNIQLPQGYNTVVATYNPTSLFAGSSSPSFTQLMEEHATQSTNTWCNNAPVSTAGSTVPLAYPSIIGVSGYSGNPSVGNVTVELEGATSTDGFLDRLLLVAPGGGAYNLDFLDDTFTSNSMSNQTLTIADGGANPFSVPSTSASGTWEPTDDNPNSPDTFPALQSPAIDSNIPAVPTTPNYPQTKGGAGAITFEQAFNGAPVNGEWALYIAGADPFALNSGWCITFDVNTGSATTTSVASNHPQATFGQSVTITATVQSGGNPVNQGTVTFVDSTASVTLASNVAVNGSGQATYTSSAFSEGDHKITASYNGTPSFNPSFNFVWQRVDHATTVAAVGDTTWQYCNTGAVLGQSSGAYTPNPSNIFVTNFPGTLNSVAVDLNNFSIYQEAPPYLASLIEAPSGAALDFFSNTGGLGNEQANAGNYIFEDSASGEVPNSGSNIVPGSYKPTSYQPSYASQDSFISSQSGFYNVPSSFSTAPPQTSANFASTFPSGSNPNGTWSLFFNQDISATEPSGATNGWCVQLIENPPVVTPTLAHSGDFTQGQQGASFTVNVENTGPGSTADPTLGSHPLTVVDVLNSAFTYANFSGTGWSCSPSGQTVTCTNDNAVAINSSYPQLTIDLNVANSASGTINNSATVSGAGVAPTSSNTDAITIQPAPILSVTKSHTGTFTQGSTAVWDIVVSNSAPSSITNGTVTVVDTLPTGYTLSNATGTGWSCGGTGTVTCTSTQGVSGGSSFFTLALTVNVPANSPTSVSNTASVYGGGDLNHSSLGTAATGSDNGVPVSQVPASIAINGSQTQSAQVGTAFGSLAVTVKDGGGAIIPNYSSVTFTATTAGSGATGTFSNATGTISVAADGSGVANPGTFTANNNSGSYNVGVTAGTATTSFSLTNTAITPTITWTPVTTIIVGDAGLTVLDASVNCTSCGTITYTATPGGTIASTSALAVGSYTITATFNPGSNEYSTTSATSPLTVSSESVWIADGSGGTSELAGNGFGITSSAYPGAAGTVAIDAGGNVWTTPQGAGGDPQLEETNQLGAIKQSISSGGGLFSPQAIAVDGNGQVWISNANNLVSEFSNAGAPLSPSNGFTADNMATPSGIAIDLGGSVWVASRGSSNLIRLLGAAAPAAPLSTAAKNNTTGAKP